MGVVVCDLDGTLVDVRGRDYAAYVMALETVGLPPIPDNEFWSRRRSGARIIELLGVEAGEADRDAVLAAFVRVVERDELLDLDTLFRDAMSFIAAVHNAGWRTVLCTLRRRPEGVKRQLDRLGLQVLLEDVYVVGADEDGPKASTLKRFAPEGAVMIGDTEADISSARLAGVPVYAVTTGIRDRQYLARHAPDVIVDSLTELLPLLRGTA